MKQKRASKRKRAAAVACTDLLRDAAQPDGGLYDLGWYIAWTPGEQKADLDAYFSAAELRAIAKWMDDHQPKSPNK